MTAELSAQRLAELVEFGEADAYEDLFRHAPPDLGLSVMRSGGAVLLIAPSLPIILFNRVIGLGLREPATEAALDEILARYRAAGSTTFAVQLSPSAAPSDLPAWLQARGLPLRDNWAKVYRAATPDVVVRTDLRIERIGQAHAAAFAESKLHGIRDAGDDAALVGCRRRPAWLGALPGVRRRDAGGRRCAVRERRCGLAGHRQHIAGAPAPWRAGRPHGAAYP